MKGTFNLGDDADFNTATSPGTYYYGNVVNAKNAPSTSYGYLTMIVATQGTTVLQIAFGGRQSQEGATRIWVRYYANNGWKPWYYTQMTAVATE